MRDEDKGEDTIKEQIGLLESNTANGLKMTFYIIYYIPNYIKSQ